MGTVWRGIVRDLKGIAELVAPTACAGCRAPGVRWCGACRREIAAARPGPWSPSPWPDGFPPTWSGPPYEGAVRGAILAWKEQDRVDLTPVLAEVLAEVLATALASGALHTEEVPELVLVPAPSSRAGTRARGRRPVTELAVAVAGRGRVVDALQLVRRVRDQSGLGTEDRARNLRGAVGLTARGAERVRGRPCVIVDDVVTTGATLVDCTRALHEAGSGPVLAVTVAATVRRRGRPRREPRARLS